MRIFLGCGEAELGGREGAFGRREGPFGAQGKHASPLEWAAGLSESGKERTCAGKMS